MAEELTPEFTDALLEADMRQLAEEVLKAREHPENKNLTEREILKQSLKAFTPAPAAPAQPAPSAKSPLPLDVQNAPPEVKLEIEYLLDMAFHQGLEKANKAAFGTSPFVLDAFHDVLAGKLYPELQKRGIVK